MAESDPTSVSCSDCAAQMPATAAFCPACGRSMPGRSMPGRSMPGRSMPGRTIPAGPIAESERFEDPMPAASRAEGKVGIFSEPIAGALAYFTFIPAIIFLLRPPYNRDHFVRFHSAQCLLFWLASASMTALLRLAALVVILIPTLGPLLVTLISVVFGLALVMIWIVLVVKAFQGEMFEFPVLGALADRYTDPL